MGKWLLGRGPPTHRLKATDTEVSFNGNHRRVVEIKGGSLPWIDFKRYEVNMRIVVAVVGDEPVDAANYNLNNLSVRKSERERGRKTETMGNCLFVCIVRRRRRRAL